MFPLRFMALRRSVDGKHLIRFQRETSVFKFLRRSVHEKHLMRFQSKTFVFKFLRRSVDGKHLMRFQSESFVFQFLIFDSSLPREGNHVYSVRLVNGDKIVL